MKKTVIFTALILTLALSVFAFAACNKDKDNENKYKGYCFIEKELYVAESDNFFIELSLVAAESPFIADGKAGELKEFMELTVYGKGLKDGARFRFKSEPDNILGTLKTSLRRGDFTAKFESAIKLADGLALEIEVGENHFEEFALTNAMSGSIGYSAAVEKAREHFAQRFEKEKAENGDAQREIYFRIARDPHMRGAYYYFVSFIGSGADFWSALIDPSDGTVISSN